MVSPCKVSSYKISDDLLTKWMVLRRKLKGKNVVAWSINYSWRSVRDSNLAPPKYKSEALPLQPNELLARGVVIISYEGVCE